MNLIFAGLGIGLAMAAPLGPVNLLVIRAALNRGLQIALPTAAGALVADVLMSAIAAYGLQAIEKFIVDYAHVLEIVGGIVLVVIGVRTARLHFSTADLAPAPAALRIGMPFILTVTNPGTPLGFLAIFSAMSQVLQLNAAPWRSTLVVMGVALGGALWWIFVSTLTVKFSSRIGPKLLERINRWSGVLIAAFGFVLLSRALI